MPTNFVEELKWRGLLFDITPETEKFLLERPEKGYIGFDPTADSMHIGSLVQIIILMHFQKAGHSPIILLGGATGMIGDPSGKSDERNLLDQKTLVKNCNGIKKQFEKYISRCVYTINTRFVAHRLRTMARTHASQPLQHVCRDVPVRLGPRRP